MPRQKTYSVAEAARAGTTPPDAALAGVVAAAPEKLELWRVTVGATVGSGAGASVHGSWRAGRAILTEGLDQLDGRTSARTLVLSGAGAVLALAVPTPFALLGEWVGGFDAVERPKLDVAAAMGARVGVAWSPPRLPAYAVQLSVTGVLDLFRGSFVRPACVYATLGFGMAQR